MDMSPTMQRYLAALEASPNGLTRVELAEKLHLSGTKSCVKSVLKRLKDSGFIHVGSWQARECAPTIAVYVAGSGADKKRPPAKTDKQKYQECRNRMRRDFGDELTKKIYVAKKRGSSSLVIGGVMVYQRHAGRGRAINYAGINSLMKG
jgi:hypothetical protein